MAGVSLLSQRMIAGRRDAVMDSLLDSSDPVLITDASLPPPFQVIAVNAAWTRVCGYTQAEAFGKSPDTLLQCDETDVEAAKKFTTALITDGVASDQFVNRSKDNLRFKHRLTARKITNAEGKPLFVARSTMLELPSAFVARTAQSPLVLGALLCVVLASGLASHFVAALGSRPPPPAAPECERFGTLLMGARLRAAGVPPCRKPERPREASAVAAAAVGPSWLNSPSSSGYTPMSWRAADEAPAAEAGVRASALFPASGLLAEGRGAGWSNTAKRVLPVGGFVSLATLANWDLFLVRWTIQPVYALAAAAVAPLWLRSAAATADPPAAEEVEVYASGLFPAGGLLKEARGGDWGKAVEVDEPNWDHFLWAAGPKLVSGY